MQALSGGKSILLHVSMLTFVALLLSAGAVEGKKRATPQPTGVPARINALAQQLPGVMLEDAGPTISQIQKLVVDDLSQWMANRTPTDVEVRRRLEYDFSLLHYPLVGLPATFAQPWNGQVIIGAGYTLGWTDYDRQNVLAIFSSSMGKSQLLTVTHPIPRIDLHFEVLPQAGWSDLRFVLYGFRPGKSQLRLSVVVYSFDGQNLKSLWQVQDMYAGKIDFLNDKFTISYLREDEYVRAVQENQVPPRHLATYQVTAAGVQLVDDHEIPY